jgi:hypothetical protein
MDDSRSAHRGLTEGQLDHGDHRSADAGHQRPGIVRGAVWKASR